MRTRENIQHICSSVFHVHIDKSGNNLYRCSSAYRANKSAPRHMRHIVHGYDHGDRPDLRRTGYTSACLVYGGIDRLPHTHRTVCGVDHVHTSDCPYRGHSTHAVVNDHIVLFHRTHDSDFGVFCVRREILRCRIHCICYVAVRAHICSSHRILRSIASPSREHSNCYPYRVYSHYESSGAHIPQRPHIGRNSMDIYHAHTFCAGRASWVERVQWRKWFASRQT